MRSKILACLSLVLLFALFSCSNGGGENETVVAEKEVESSEAKMVVTGTVTSVKGEAYVIKDGVETKAQIGMKVGVGYAVKTEASSELDFKVGDLGVFKIKENSEMKVDSLIGAGSKDVNLNVKKGKLLLGLRRLAKTERAVVTTPTAVAAVRGTSFVVNAESSETKISVLTGTVRVNNDQGSVDVEELNEVSVNSDSEIEVVSISRVSFADVKSILEIKDIGEVKNVGDLYGNLKKLSLTLEDVDSVSVESSEVEVNATKMDMTEKKKKDVIKQEEEDIDAEASAEITEEEAEQENLLLNESSDY